MYHVHEGLKFWGKILKTTVAKMFSRPEIFLYKHNLHEKVSHAFNKLGDMLQEKIDLINVFIIR